MKILFEFIEECSPLRGVGSGLILRANFAKGGWVGPRYKRKREEKREKWSSIVAGEYRGKNELVSNSLVSLGVKNGKLNLISITYSYK